MLGYVRLTKVDLTE